MMEAVHATTSPEILRQPRLRVGQRHRVYGVAAALGLAVLELRTHVLGEVLVECAAKLHIDQLRSAADAENRQPMAQRQVEQALLEVVARSVDVNTLVLLLFTVQRRVDVLPTGENNAVKLAGGRA